MLKGWKTIAFGLFVAIAPPALVYLGGIDWTSFGISPAIASSIGIAIIALRAATSTAVGKKVCIAAALMLGLASFAHVAPASAATARIHAVLPFDPLGLNGKVAATPAGAAVDPLAGLTDVLKAVAAARDHIVGEVTTIGWMGAQIIPGTTPPAPYDAYAVQCSPALIQFLNSLPVQAAIPTAPAGDATGPLVDFEILRLQAKSLDTFISSIQINKGFPDYVKLGCAAYLQDAANLPIKIGLDANANLISLLGFLAK